MKQGGPRRVSAGRGQREAASDGLFTKLADLFLGASDAEKERRRLLKQSARALRKLGTHYYNPKTEQAEVGLARLFYEFYKAFAPGQRILHNARNSSVLKSIVIDTVLSKEQLALKEGLSEESLRRRAQSVGFDQLRTEAQNEMSSLLASFDINRTKQVNDTHGSLSLLLDLILFDYYYFLRKFDPQLSESRRDYVPRFRATNSQYVTEQLEEFLDILPAIDLSQNWAQILDILKAYRGVEAVTKDGWRRASHLLRKLQGSRELELALQLFTRNPFYKPKPKVYRDNVVEEFLSRFKLQTEATIQKLAKERKAGKLQSLVTQLFANRSPMRLSNLSEEANKVFGEKLLGGYRYVMPLNCLHSFMADYLESELGKTVEFLLIPAKWADNAHSRVVSDAFHNLQGIARELQALDGSLSEEHELGRRLASAVSRAQKNQQAQFLARRIIEKVNAQSKDLLLKASQQAVGLGKELKLVIDDTERHNSQLILNWRELASRANRDLRQMLISSYKLLYFLVQLIKLYL